MHDQTGGSHSRSGIQTGPDLAAAGALFLENGYGAVSMDAVSKKANVSKATLYAHFGSKDELFRAMVACECSSAGLNDVWDKAMALPAADGLRMIGLEFVTFVLSPKALAAHRVVLGEAHRFPELARAFYEAGPALTIGRVNNYLSLLNGRGELAIPDIDMATQQYFGLIKANLHMKLLLCLTERPSDLTIQRFVDAAVDLFVKGYAPPAP